MQNMIDENTAMCERILADIQLICNSYHDLNEFTIVPIDESRNKSPVLYEQQCLGLESWCVKHVYNYVYTQLFHYKPHLRKLKLFQQKLEQIDKLLITGLLLHADITTFWNIRRELFELGVTDIDKELSFTKLVLSHKSKSNECFAYRKWIINKLTTNISENNIMALINKEFDLTEMAAEKSPNNYHAWSHRIWCIQNILTKTDFVQTAFYINVILSELDFSNVWINKHVSEHSGFHYRQYLCNNVLKNEVTLTVSDIKYRCLIESYMGIKFSDCDNVAYLNKLVGVHEISNNNNHMMLKCCNYVYYFIILLSDLFYYIEQLNETFPGHEAIWYHRRFVVYSLLKGAYDYHNLTWKKTVTMNKLNTLPNDFKMIITDIDNVRGIGEKSAKLLKYEVDKVESSYLYKLLLESETKCIKENTLNESSPAQKELAIRHGRWLKFVLGLNSIVM